MHCSLIPITISSIIKGLFDHVALKVSELVSLEDLQPEVLGVESVAIGLPLVHLVVWSLNFSLIGCYWLRSQQMRIRLLVLKLEVVLQIQRLTELVLVVLKHWGQQLRIA